MRAQLEMLSKNCCSRGLENNLILTGKRGHLRADFVVQNEFLFRIAKHAAAAAAAGPMYKVCRQKYWPRSSAFFLPNLKNGLQFHARFCGGGLVLSV